MEIYISTEDELNFKSVIFLSSIIPFMAYKSMASQPAISGSDLSTLIIRHLTSIGVESSPAINTNRIFHGCDEADISIERRGSSWKTIELKCEKNERWNYTFRNKLSDIKSNGFLKIKYVNKPSAKG